MPRRTKRVKHAMRMVSARNRIAASSSVASESIDASSDSSISKTEVDEWLLDSLDVNERCLSEALRWTSGARPGTRKHHDGFGRSSTFAKKAKMKKMQVQEFR